MSNHHLAFDLAVLFEVDFDAFLQLPVDYPSQIDWRPQKWGYDECTTLVALGEQIAGLLLYG
jgi:hypothetical protein